MTGLTFPVFMSSCMMVRSSLLRLIRTTTIFWLANRDNTAAEIALAKGPIIHGPLGPPTPMYIPLEFRTRLHADDEWFPTQSRNSSHYLTIIGDF